MIIDGTTYYTMAEVAAKIGVSEETIRLWYRWENKNLDTCQRQLPDKIFKDGIKKVLFDEQGLKKLIIFKSKIIRGRKGTMGISSKYYTEEVKLRRRQQYAEKKVN